VLNNFIKALQLPENENEVHLLFKQIDKDNTGELDEKEWQALGIFFPESVFGIFAPLGRKGSPSSEFSFSGLNFFLSCTR
jgi:hypothetical protein